MQSANTGLHFDAQSLSGLRARARDDQQAALREAAGQFEALFVQMVFKSMREASQGDALFGSDQGDYYRDLLDRQFASDLSAGGGIGLAEMLVRQLGGESAPRAPVSASGAVMGPSSALPATRAGTTSDTAAAATDWDSPQAFVRAVYPQAEQAARELGVPPALLVAQSALETGWGTKVARHPDGSNSYALFGIKADARWDGERVDIRTLEFEAGQFRPQRAEFRAYASPAEAFADYVDFLRTGPRYQSVLERVDDPRAYVDGLQAAGYATDPDYAEKIWNIYRGDLLRSGLDGLPRAAAGALDTTAAGG